MNKFEYFELLKKRLAGIPTKELDEAIAYYDEIISDKVEDGMNEQEAVQSLGNIDDVVNSILSDVSISKLVKEKFAPKRKLTTWEIILLSITSIVWIPLLVALIIVILAIYIALWSGVIALASGAIYCLANSLLTISGAIDIFTGNFGSGFILIGFGMLFAGLAILLTIATIKLSKIMIVVCKKLILKIKSLFIKRGENNENCA